MQGEHVVELANMLGMNMTQPHKAGESKAIKVSVDVITEWDTFEGKWVDVDYPALPAVQRPKSNVELFPTWDSRNLPNLVCAYDATKPLDGSHCEDVGIVQQDLATGELLYEVSEDAWIGTACSSDADCAFEESGQEGRCLTGPGGGYCTISCEGYCPDKAGEAGTFCGKASGGGACMSKAALENDGCADIPGTKAKQVDRFVGASGAPAKVATVCSF